MVESYAASKFFEVISRREDNEFREGIRPQYVPAVPKKNIHCLNKTGMILVRYSDPTIMHRIMGDKRKNEIS